MWSVRAAVAGLAVATTTACSLLIDFDGLANTSNAVDGSVGAGDATSPVTDVADAASIDAADASSTDGATADASTSPCVGAGPTMVMADTFCIDTTDVTNADYQTFVAASTGINAQPAYCSWNTSFTLKCAEASADPKAPVTCVNWCDARAYCLWAGKRLCGAVGGGPGASANTTDPALDQWYHACSKNGALAYPYGNTYKPALCDDNMYGANKPIPVGSDIGCVGPYPGLVDMQGNAVEWVDVCDSTNGENDICYIRSSAFDDGDVDCTDSSGQGRNSADDTKGFRCCADP